MAQQTINVGTAPNDGTGTPLRTAFQYTNSNFSELYTAVGPSGNNIVVPGSATITGDLTVDTSTLKVDSTNNRVGVGTASPSGIFHAANLGTAGTTADNFNGYFSSANRNCSIYLLAKNTEGSNFYFGDGDNNTIGGIIYDHTSNYMRFDANGSEQMRLNATGLGIGVSPSNNLHVQGASGATAIRISAVTDGTLGFIGSASGLISGSPANNLAVRAENGLYLSGGGNATQFILNSSGNVGIGVTPSALLHVQKSQNSETTAIINNTNTGTSAGVRLDLQSNGSNYLTLQSFGQNYSGNAFGIAAAKLNVVSENSATAFSSGLAIGTTSSNPLYFATSNAVKMTLDASGNLLVGKTAIGTTVGVEVRPDGYIIATRSASTDAAAFTNAVYSTGAAAYRFYVGMGGTVYATNTTISAISDQRLKENVQDIDVGLGAILALKPRKFDWKEGKGKNIKGDRGFIAQEFEQVFPQLVDQWADEAPEGEAPYKSVRQDLIPVLVKAIQELTARVQTLETR